MQQCTAPRCSQWQRLTIAAVTAAPAAAVTAAAAAALVAPVGAVAVAVAVAPILAAAFTASAAPAAVGVLAAGAPVLLSLLSLINAHFLRQITNFSVTAYGGAAIEGGYLEPVCCETHET
jgi:hypothetical protein